MPIQVISETSVFMGSHLHGTTSMATEESPDLGVQPRDSRRRIVIEPSGQRWSVYEAPFTYDRRVNTLVFESDLVIRRSRMFPADWFDLSDEELMRLAEST
jgi:hypothetical protein